MGCVEVVIRKIKLLRESNNYTQQYVADELELSQNAYSLIEKGLTKLTIERLEQIATFYKIEVSDFFTSESLGLTSGTLEGKRDHNNLPPAVSPMEKILYEKTIQHLESNLSRLYSLIDQLTAASVRNSAGKDLLTAPEDAPSFDHKSNKADDL
ncbi:MAG TPA: helix-turn-helix transcriptional regulator [Edaphocola sp.]|nr:helix-turn-helix transcriptional regulator [Edaphocola sp.]